MAGTGPRRLGLVAAMSLLVGVAVAGMVVGPRLAPSLLAHDGTLAKAKRKLQALRTYGLFRARGDRAVLRAGDPPAPRHSAPGH